MCEVDASTDVITVTGSTVCPDNYVREYYGWTMGSHYTHARQETICVAVDAVASPHDIRTGAPALVYPTEMDGAYGSHEHDGEITCAVCSRCVGADCRAEGGVVQAELARFDP